MKRKADKKVFISTLRDQCRGNLTETCKVLGWDYDTFRRHRARDPEFSQAVAQAQGEAKGIRIDRAERKLDEAVNKGEPWAIRFFLERQARDRGYGPYQTVEMLDSYSPRKLTAEDIETLKQINGIKD